ncbi:IclR family transcriptional regulator [soil metagenome]
MASVQSIERAFTILEVVSDEARGVTEIAGKADLPKSTVARLLSTLEHLGVVERVDDGSDYRLGPRLQQLVGPGDPTARLVDRVHPCLEWLALQLGEGTGFAVPNGSAIQVVSQVEGPHAVQVRNYSGELFPAHVGAPGVVLMAQWDEAALDRYLAHPLTAYTEHTVVHPHQIRDRIAQVQRDGVCWAHEEFAEGISTVAAAVYGSSGRVLGALYAHGPTYRFPAPDSVQWTADLIYRTAGEIFATTKS